MNTFYLDAFLIVLFFTLPMLLFLIAIIESVYISGKEGLKK